MEDQDQEKEPRLIERAQEGDAGAFERLVRKYQNRIFNTIYRSLHDRESAADLTQEAFLKAFRNIDKYDDRAKFSTWLHRIAMNCLISHVRHESAAKRGGPGSDASLNADNMQDPDRDLRVSGGYRSQPEESMEAREQRELIEAAIQSLDIDHRQVLVLRDIEGMSYDNIAEVLDLKTGTVRSRLFRARDILRGKLADLID